MSIEFITSDLHLGHRNIIKYTGRPYSFEDPECISKMNEDILRAFDELPENSVVWNLGDVFFGKWTHQATFSDLKSLVDRMKNKNKILKLVLGNHDFQVFRPFKNDWKEAVDFFKDLGFDEVYANPVYYDDIHLFSHEPVDLSKYKENVLNVHGHTHDIKVSETFFEKGTLHEVDISRYHNACWDVDFRIKSIQEIL